MRRQVAALAAFALTAAPAHALTIEEAMAEAVRSNPNVLAARQAARFRHEEVPLALSAWRPAIEVIAAGSLTRIGSAPVTGTTLVETPVYDDNGNYVGRTLPLPVPAQGGGASDGRNREALELVLTQNLYRGGGRRAVLRQAEEEVRLGHASAETVEQQVLLQTAAVYLDVLRAERFVELREASLAAFRAHARDTRTQFQVGDRTRADVAQADAEQEVAAAEAAAAKANLQVQRALFETVVGLPPEDLEAVGEPAGLPESLDAARRAAESGRPAVRVAVHAERAASHAVRAAKGELGPRVDLSGAITRAVGHGDSGLNSTDVTVGVRLTMPLYQAGSGGARLRRAEHLRAQLRDERVAAQREAAQWATGAWRNLHSARQRHAALTAAVEASLIALAGIRREAEIGERTIREVLDAERSLVSYQVRALDAERDAVVHAYTLLEAVGALTARALGIEGLADLDREAEEARRSFAPGWLRLRRSRN